MSITTSHESICCIPEVTDPVVFYLLCIFVAWKSCLCLYSVACKFPCYISINRPDLWLLFQLFFVLITFSIRIQISMDIIGAKETLLGHSDAITSIYACRPYSIVVTGSKDTLAIVWDLNRYVCYVLLKDPGVVVG